MYRETEKTEAGPWDGAESIWEKAYAKINLSLDILSRREDGYHNLRMVMQSVDLCDILEIQKADGIQLSCTKSEIPVGRENTVFRAAELFCRETGALGARIRLHKRIPSQAGMGGGSADAAATLRGLNRLYNAGLSENTLREIGIKVGADVPFCVKNGLCLAEGTGEILTPLGEIPPCRILICKPEIGVSTGEAFRRADVAGRHRKEYTSRVLEALSSQSLSSLGKSLGNDFQTIMHIPEVEKIRAMMLESGAAGSVMTGSGSAVFGLFSPEGKEAMLCAEKLKKSYKDTFLCAAIYPE